MNCWFCGVGKLIWNVDFSFEDYGLEGEGIVAILTCSECGATWEGYSGEEEKKVLDNTIKI